MLEITDMKNLLFLIAFGLATTNNSHAANPDDILGIWANHSNKGHIKIYRQNGKYFGKIVWLKVPLDANGLAKMDKKNPDINSRNQPLLGLVMLRDFKYDDDEWKDGKIYNPDDGREYKAYMKLKDSKTLSVRGYVGFSFIGKTETFNRVR
jgi:uncharacterized protein (DUF2147 family)